MAPLHNEGAILILMDIKDQLKSITKGVTEIINVEGLEKKLQQSKNDNKPLRVKAGFDPTAPDIHLGHVVLLRKLRQFQDLGHQVDFIVGDFTALVGDPSGKNKLRPTLERSFIDKNAKTYTKQALKVLDEKKTNIIFNSHWLEKLDSATLVSLTSRTTVAQMLARNDFKIRYEQGRDISIMEFIYPLLQGLDSYVLSADIELGGNDQKFNLLMGRQIQMALKEDKKFLQFVQNILKKKSFKPAEDPQVIIMTPLIEGVDGVQKMSKSLGNYIGINESPKEIFGKIMSINDDLMFKYAEYLTNLDVKNLKESHPKESKMKLACDIVKQFYGEKEAAHAKEEFANVFSQNKAPEEVSEIALKERTIEELANTIAKLGIVGSKNEFRRLLKQGAMTFENIKINENWVPTQGVLKIGKRRFIKIK